MIETDQAISEYNIIDYWKRTVLLMDYNFIYWSTCWSSLCCPINYICCCLATLSICWSCSGRSACCTSSRPSIFSFICSVSRYLFPAWILSPSASRISSNSSICQGSYIKISVPSSFFLFKIVIIILLYFFKGFVFLLFLLQFLLHGFSLSL